MIKNETPDLQPCAFCGHPFDQDALGVYGCPNCEGEGLDEKPDAITTYYTDRANSGLANRAR